MYEVAQVRLREAGKILYYDITGFKAKVGEYLIVEAERGVEYGQILAEPEVILDANIEHTLKKVVRAANKKDLSQIEENKEKIKDVSSTCLKKIEEHKLDMKLVDAEYSFDRSKIVFYFTADGRIDFRGLVKDLARIFKVRIELRQIGVRDEAKMLGGFGPCGRSLCCAQFLRDFEPVTIRMAKDQGLSLNPTKISGLCGRLMCCLGYEYKNYKELLKAMPKEGDRINIKEGKAKVIGVNPLKGTVTVEVGEEARQLEISYCCDKECAKHDEKQGK